METASCFIQPSSFRFTEIPQSYFGVVSHLFEGPLCKIMLTLGLGILILSIKLVQILSFFKKYCEYCKWPRFQVRNHHKLNKRLVAATPVSKAVMLPWHLRGKIDNYYIVVKEKAGFPSKTHPYTPWITLTVAQFDLQLSSTFTTLI